MMKLIRWLTCKCREKEFIRNIYGDMINVISPRNKTMRSEWKCTCCGRISYDERLINKPIELIKDRDLKIIFLDIDGVLNNEKWFIHSHNHWKETNERLIDLDPELVKLLGLIVCRTKAKVVVSSSWRGGWDNWMNPVHEDTKEATKMFSEFGITLFSKTGSIRRSDEEYGSWRENEINDWLIKHPNVTSFVVIDDESFDLMSFVGTRLVKTSHLPDGEMVRQMSDGTGLREEDVELAISILNNPITPEEWERLKIQF